MQMNEHANPTPAELKLVFEIHANLCKALANKHRLAIIYTLGQGEMCVTDLATEIGVPIHNVSQHLRILQERLLVQSRRDGKRVYYFIANFKFIQGCTLIRQALVEQHRASNQTLMTADLMDAVARIPRPGLEGETPDDPNDF